MRNSEMSCWFKRVLKMLIFCPVTYFGGKCIPVFYNANTEEISVGVVFNNWYRKSKRVICKRQIC